MNVQLTTEQTETSTAPITPEEVVETTLVMGNCPHLSDCLNMKTCLGACQ